MLTPIFPNLLSKIQEDRVELVTAIGELEDFMQSDRYVDMVPRNIKPMFEEQLKFSRDHLDMMDRRIKHLS